MQKTHVTHAPGRMHMDLANMIFSLHGFIHEIVRARVKEATKAGKK